MLLVMSLHPRGSQSIFQVFQAVVTDFTKATAWKVAQTTPVFLHPFKNVLLEFTEGFQMDSLFTPFQFPHKQTGWCTGALTLFILPLQFSLQAPCGLCRCVSSWVISAGCQGRATSGHGPALPGPGSSTGEARNGHLEDSRTWSKGKNTPGKSLNVKDELKALLPVRNFTLHNP